jgi:hypothetical protein
MTTTDSAPTRDPVERLADPSWSGTAAVSGPA